MSVKEMYMGREMTGATTLAESVYEEMGGTTPLITESQTVKGAVNELKTIEGTKAYDNTATYAVGDYCIYNSIRYKCITAVTTAEDFDSTKWSATTTNNDITQLNSSLPYKQEVTVTTSSAGLAGVATPFDKVISASIATTGQNWYILTRKATDGSTACFIFNNTFNAVTNTSVTISIWRLP